jgi:hypothetical protein
MEALDGVALGLLRTWQGIGNVNIFTVLISRLWPTCKRTWQRLKR